VFVREQLRKKVNAEATDSWERIQRFFEVHGITTSPEFDHAQLLQMIEQELPESFPQLAQNRNFRSLLEGFGGPDERIQLREKMRRYAAQALDTLDTAPTSRRRDRIFISYQRGDAGFAGRIYDALTQQFGADRVFIDVENVSLGVDWRETIDATIASSAVVLAVIGPQWLTEVGTTGPFDDKTDFIRAELAAALRLQKRVIPVLVGEARMPTEDELPDELASLARRHAVSMSSEAWRADLDQLTRAVERTTSGASAKTVLSAQ
jgi:hypothetical protein